MSTRTSGKAPARPTAAPAAPANEPVDLSYHEDAQQVDAGPLVSVIRGETDSQVATARAYPRSIKGFVSRLTDLVTLDEQTAASCMYAVQRGREVVKGPSARFAELAAYAWGNMRIDGRPVAEQDRFITSRGMAWDLEANVAVAFEARRRITGKDGRRYNDDMITVTSNAASSIAMRNAVLKVIPTALWKPIYEAARRAAVGDQRTLSERRKAALERFAKLGVPPEKVYAKLGVVGLEDITLDHVEDLIGIFTAITEGASTIDEAFDEPAAVSPAAGIRDGLAALVPDPAQRARVDAALELAGVTTAQRVALVTEWRAAKLDAAAVLARVDGLTRSDAGGGSDVTVAAETRPAAGHVDPSATPARVADTPAAAGGGGWDI